MARAEGTNANCVAWEAGGVQYGDSRCLNSAKVTMNVLRLFLDATASAASPRAAGLSSRESGLFGNIRASVSTKYIRPEYAGISSTLRMRFLT